MYPAKAVLASKVINAIAPDQDRSSLLHARSLLLDTEPARPCRYPMSLRSARMIGRSGYAKQPARWPISLLPCAYSSFTRQTSANLPSLRRTKRWLSSSAPRFRSGTFGDEWAARIRTQARNRAMLAPQPFRVATLIPIGYATPSRYQFSRD